MPSFEDIMFLRKYHPQAKKCYICIKKCALTIVNLILWWSVVLCVCTALTFHYVCHMLNLFSIESHAIYVMVCRNMGLLLEYFSSKNIMTKDNSFRTRIIMDRVNDKPYLLRHYLLIQNRENFPFNVFIHKFMKGDEDDIHDHPWGFFHIILSGGYWEYITVNDDGETLDQGMKKVWRPPGYWNIASSKYKHKIELASEKPWTIFIPFGKRAINEPWGFWKPPSNNTSSTKWKKIDNITYLENNSKK